VRNKAVYLVIGVRCSGQKETLGLWIAQSEGAKFWLRVVTEPKNRGTQDILIAVVYGLKGFPEAIESVFPEADVGPPNGCLAITSQHEISRPSCYTTRGYNHELKRGTSRGRRNYTRLLRDQKPVFE